MISSPWVKVRRYVLNPHPGDGLLWISDHFLLVLRQVDEAEEGHIGQAGRLPVAAQRSPYRRMSPSVSSCGVKKLVRMGRSRPTATSTLAAVRDTARCTGG